MKKKMSKIINKNQIANVLIAQNSNERYLNSGQSSRLGHHIRTKSKQVIKIPEDAIRFESNKKIVLPFFIVDIVEERVKQIKKHLILADKPNEKQFFSVSSQFICSETKSRLSRYNFNREEKRFYKQFVSLLAGFDECKQVQS